MPKNRFIIALIVPLVALIGARLDPPTRSTGIHSWLYSEAQGR
jgi:hypothetical protein